MKRVYDFNAKTCASGFVGRPREIEWPCEMFRITMPKPGKREEQDFNPIEVCVLKLLSYGQYEPKDLANETCLPKDLIEVILLRLYDRECIDDHYKLKPDVLKLIERQAVDNDEMPTEYVSFVVFRECIEGSILPMVIDANNLRAEEINDDGSIDKGKNKPVFLHRIHNPENNTNDKGKITSQEVIKVLRTMARRRKLAGGTYSIPSQDYISVESTFETCSLWTRMILQKSGDWRILNPFERGWSPELEAAYRSLLRRDSEEGKSLLEWQKKNLVEDRITVTSVEHPREPYDTTENNLHYPQLLAWLRGDNPDIIPILEWALFYSLKQFDTRKIVQLFHIDIPQNNERRLEEAIKALTHNSSGDSLIPMPLDENVTDAQKDNLSGEPKTPKGQVKDNVESSPQKEEDRQNLTNLPGMKRIRVPQEGKLTSFQTEGMAEMSVVLPIALLLAQEEPRFPLEKIFREYPDFLSIIGDLQKRHNIYRHNKSIWKRIYGEDDYSFMKKVVTMLLPSIVFSDLPIFTEDKTNVDSQLMARLKLQDILGIAAFDQMDSILQDSLLRAEIIRQNYASAKNEPFDAVHGVNLLYAALQGAFRPFLIGQRPTGALMELASQKAYKAGLGKLPISLSSVRSEMIQTTLDGYDQTLGASVITWLLLSDIDILYHVAQRHKSFFGDIDRLLTLNKHGNQICMMTPKDFSTLSDSVHKIIITITEA